MFGENQWEEDKRMQKAEVDPVALLYSSPHFIQCVQCRENLLEVGWRQRREKTNTISFQGKEKNIKQHKGSMEMSLQSPRCS